MAPIVYPAGAMQLARKLHAAAPDAWTYRELARAVEREYGTRPSPNTICRWVNPRAAARNNHSSNRARARKRAENNGGRLLSSRHKDGLTPEFKLARICGLRAAGLSHRAIAAVMRFDLGEPITSHHVEYAMQTGRYPRSLLAD